MKKEENKKRPRERERERERERKTKKKKERMCARNIFTSPPSLSLCLSVCLSPSLRCCTCAPITPKRGFRWCPRIGIAMGSSSSRNSAANQQQPSSIQKTHRGIKSWLPPALEIILMILIYLILFEKWISLVYLSSTLILSWILKRS